MSSTRKWIFRLARLLVTGAAIALVARSIRLEELLGALAGIDRLLFAAMLAVALVPLFFLALRWWLLLEGNGFRVPLGRAFLLCWVGMFFNSFLPGAVGGDVAKLLIASAGESRKAALAGTVILDRVVGLAVLIAVGAACSAPFLGRLADHPLTWLVWTALAGLVLAVALYASPLARRLPARMPFREVALQLQLVLLSLRGRPALAAAALGCSLAVQAGLIGLAFGLSRAVGLQGAEPWMFFAFVPIALLAGGLPISLGGWGVQEFVFAELFGKLAGLDSAHAVALSVIFKLAQLLASIPGGLLYGLGALQRADDGSARGRGAR